MKVVVSGIELTIENANEILSMGGPYLADISLANKLISKNCLLNNFIFQEDMNLLFFVKYHCINLYKYFTINFYNVDDLTVYEFEKEFDMVHLGKFKSKNELEIYHAFHDELLSTKLIFNIDKEEFNAVL